MIQNVIARRYARSLIGLAQEKNALDEFGKQLSSLVAVCSENSGVLVTLANRFFDINARERIVNELAERLKLNILVANFIKLLIRKGRIEFLNDVCSEYLAFANQLQNRCDMIVESAAEMGADQYSALADVFSAKTGKEVILRKRIKPELLGGARVVVGGRVYDYSVKSQMDAMQNLLAQE